MSGALYGSVGRKARLRAVVGRILGGTFVIVVCLAIDATLPRVWGLVVFLGAIVLSVCGVVMALRGRPNPAGVGTQDAPVPVRVASAPAQVAGSGVRIGPPVDRSTDLLGIELGARGEMVVGRLMLLAGVIVSVLAPGAQHSSGYALGGVLVGGIGGVLVWHGWQVMGKPDGVLVRDHGDLIVMLDGLGRTRRVPWPSIARFQATDVGGGIVYLRNGSSVRMFPATEDGRDLDKRRDEIAAMVARLNEILDQRAGD